MRRRKHESIDEEFPGPSREESPSACEKQASAAHRQLHITGPIHTRGRQGQVRNTHTNTKKRLRHTGHQHIMPNGLNTCTHACTHYSSTPSDTQKQTHALHTHSSEEMRKHLEEYRIHRVCQPQLHCTHTRTCLNQHTPCTHFMGRNANSP